MTSEEKSSEHMTPIPHLLEMHSDVVDIQLSDEPINLYGPDMPGRHLIVGNNIRASIFIPLSRLSEFGESEHVNDFPDAEYDCGCDCIHISQVAQVDVSPEPRIFIEPRLEEYRQKVEELAKSRYGAWGAMSPIFTIHYYEDGVEKTTLVNLRAPTRYPNKYDQI